MLQVTVDLLGIARHAVGRKQVSLELPERAKYQDLIRSLAEKYPTLVGQVIQPQTLKLSPTFMLNLEGRRVIADLSQTMAGGERLVLMFVESGG